MARGQTNTAQHLQHAVAAQSAQLARQHFAVLRIRVVEYVVSMLFVSRNATKL